MRHFKSPPKKYLAVHLALILIFFGVCIAARAHDNINTKLTWDREISRIVYTRCATCHRPGGTVFSLVSYQDAQPWANAIKTEVLERKMPPWGAVKGFGAFRNDEALTQEELDLVQNWANGGAPEGNPDDLPRQMNFPALPAIEHREGEIVASGDFKFDRPFKLDGFWPKTLPNNAPGDAMDNVSLQITLQFPNGSVEPLVWFHGYSAQSAHPFLLRNPLLVPSGTVIHGLPSGASLVLLPVIAGHQSARSAHAASHVITQEQK